MSTQSARLTNIDPDLDEQMETTVDTFRQAEEGDFVIWDNRSAALKVSDTGKHTDNDQRYLVVIGPGSSTNKSGAVIVIDEQYDNGVPAFSTDTGEPVRALRFADETEVAKGWPREEANAWAVGEREPIETPDVSMTDIRGGEPVGDIVDPGVDPGEPEDDEPEDTPGEPVPEGMADFIDDPRRPGAPDGRGFPTTLDDKTATESDPDTLVQDITSDPTLTFDEMLRDMGRHPLIEFEGFFEGEETPWTFVDELTSFGHAVPKSVNDWRLIDYGVVTGPRFRKLVWVNTESSELAGLTMVRDEPGDPAVYRVYHAQGPWHDADADEAALDPVLETNDPDAALDAVSNVLYGGDQVVNVELIEERDGTTSIRRTSDYQSLGKRTLRRLGVTVNVPEVPGERTLVGAYNATGNWFESNAEDVGRMTTLVGISTVLGLLRKIPGLDIDAGIEFSPVVDDRAFGLAAKPTANYADDPPEWLEGGIRVTIDREAFDLAEDNRFEDAVAANYVTDISEVMGVENVTMKTDERGPIGVLEEFEKARRRQPTPTRREPEGPVVSPLREDVAAGADLLAQRARNLAAAAGEASGEAFEFQFGTQADTGRTVRQRYVDKDVPEGKSVGKRLGTDTFQPPDRVAEAVVDAMGIEALGVKGLAEAMETTREQGRRRAIIEEQIAAYVASWYIEKDKDFSEKRTESVARGHWLNGRFGDVVEKYEPEFFLDGDTLEAIHNAVVLKSEQARQLLDEGGDADGADTADDDTGDGGGGDLPQRAPDLTDILDEDDVLALKRKSRSEMTDREERLAESLAEEEDFDMDLDRLTREERAVLGEGITEEDVEAEVTPGTAEPIRTSPEGTPAPMGYEHFAEMYDVPDEPEEERG